MIQLRRATLEDLPALLALEGRCFDRPWPEGAFAAELALPYAQVWLAFDEGDPRPIGYVDFWVVEGEISLLNVAVDPRARRRGLARMLLAKLKTEGRAVGGEMIFLEVRRSNEGGLALYRAAGFEQIGIRKGYYAAEKEDAIVMSRALDTDGAVG
ncbi:MAG: ribosomal protein S18-alanine N-acetyltransferase [Proteobacteria bacterium]|nr:ribosomal protein S18-alanine N-acetyltransferase [Pseudomonadota bacterium]